MRLASFGAFLLGVSLFSHWGCSELGSEQQRTKRIVSTSDAPAAIGPYSQAVSIGDMLFCSGQIGIDPKSGEIVTGGVREEARQALKNLGAVLNAADLDYGDVARATVYFADLRDYAAVNEVYAEFFKESRPSRAAVQVARLPRDARVEISCIAVAAGER